MSEEEGYKTVFLGDSGVGKSCITDRFISGIFNPNTFQSLSGKTYQKTLKISAEKSLKLNVCDTAGKDQLRPLAKMFYKDAKVIIFVYDITNEKSFKELKDFWYEKEIKPNLNKDTIFAVVGNKLDRKEKQKVKDDVAEEFAKSIGAIFESVSAKNNTGIKELFKKISEKIVGHGIEEIDDDIKEQNEEIMQLRNDLNIYKYENEDLKKEVKELKEKLEILQAESIKNIKAVQDITSEKLKEAEDAKKTIDSLREEIKEKDDTINDLRTILENLGK